MILQDPLCKPLDDGFGDAAAQGRGVCGNKLCLKGSNLLHMYGNFPVIWTKMVNGLGWQNNMNYQYHYHIHMLLLLSLLSLLYKYIYIYIIRIIII